MNQMVQGDAERVEIRLAGRGGQGLILAGVILAEAAVLYDGKNACQTQSYGAEARGGATYKHVRILLEKGLIEAEKSGRTLILRTTPLFAELFGVDNDPSVIRRKLKERMRDLGVDLGKSRRIERAQPSG